MSQCEETEEEEVDPPETSLCEQHGCQTEAQRLKKKSIEWDINFRRDQSKEDINVKEEYSPVRLKDCVRNFLSKKK